MTLPEATSTVGCRAAWNMVGRPPGTILTGAAGPLYTYQAANNAYEALPPGTPLQAGVGYWAYFPTATSVTLPSVALQDLTVQIPANHWAMVGNPLLGPVTLVLPPARTDMRTQT